MFECVVLPLLHIFGFLSCQQATGGHDVFASGGAKGAGDAVGVEMILEGGDGLRDGGEIGGAEG